MRKNVFGRQLKRDKNERKALFKSLLTSLVLHERIQTTEAKAKAIKSDADKLITKAKKGGLAAYRLLEPELISAQAVKKVLDTIAPRFAKRQGGYTRIIRVGNRLKDNAPLVLLEWTEKASADEVALEARAVTSNDGIKTKDDKKSQKEEKSPKASKKKT